MRAYFAMVWSADHPLAAQAALDIQARIEGSANVPLRLAETSGFVLYDQSGNTERHRSVPLTIAGYPQGEIFGTVFERRNGIGTQHPVTQLSEPSTAKLVQSEGRTITTDFWGNYVAFVWTRLGIAIITDPTSSLPCFYTEQKGVTLIFSHLEKCDFLDRSLFSINYAFIAKLLVYDKIQTGETGLREVCELLGGQRLQVTHKGPQVNTLWDPRDIALNVHEPSLDQASEELRETVKSVVQSHASSSDKITVELSGGLDSSIVLACLAGQGVRFRLNALHYVVDSSDLPEDRYAQLAADAASCELIKCVVPTQTHVASVTDHPLSVRPHRTFALPSFVANVDTTHTDIGNRIFTGQGGDHLFFHTRSTFGFADYLKAHGPWHGAFSQLVSNAKLSGKSVWDVIRDNMPYAVGKKTASSAIVESIAARKTWVNQHASVENLRESLPLWVTDPKGLPPAKFDQVSHLMHMVHYRDTLDQVGSKEVVHPLISQPLIELCLQLPAYLLCVQGRSRGLARLAFQGMLPESIRLRMTKGSTSRYGSAYLAFNRERILDALLHGELTRSGLIRAADVEMFFRQDRSMLQPYESMALVYYAIEAWLSSWKSAVNPPEQMRFKGTASSSN